MRILQKFLSLSSVDQNEIHPSILYYIKYDDIITRIKNKIIQKY